MDLLGHVASGTSHESILFAWSSHSVDSLTGHSNIQAQARWILSCKRDLLHYPSKKSKTLFHQNVCTPCILLFALARTEAWSYHKDHNPWITTVLRALEQRNIQWLLSTSKVTKSTPARQLLYLADIGGSGKACLLQLPAPEEHIFCFWKELSRQEVLSNQFGNPLAEKSHWNG